MTMTVLLLACILSAQAVDAGAISGRVLIRGENAPVQDARVVAVRIRRAPQPPPVGVMPRPSPQTVTGPDGSYTFEGLEPGEYAINVQKTGFAVGLGTPTRTTVVVLAGKTVKAADTFLDRGGAIAGRILDIHGEPVPDIRVSALTPAPLPPSARGSNVRPRMIPAGQSGRTDDLGEFRIFGLEPGEYVVVASEQHSPFQTGSASATTLAPTYFPGVTDEGSAQRVNVNAGQTTGGIDIRMATTNGFLVSGVVVTGEGQPVEGATLFLTDPMLAATGSYVSHAGANGRFQIANVPPGTYRLSIGYSSTGPMAKFKPPAPITITVTEGNVDGLRLVVSPGGDRNP
jgi:carboxypeptidase family protein